MKDAVITPKQKEILYLIYRYRFLTRLQIQQFLHHKDKSLIIRYLKLLVTKNYLAKVPTIQSFTSNTEPTIYYIGINGIRFLRTNNSIPLPFIANRYKENQRKASFRIKCLFLADICLMLLHQKGTGDKTHFSVILSDEYESPSSPMHFLKEIKPPLCFSKHTKTTKQYFLLDMFDETFPLYKRRKRIKSYIEFSQSYEWEEQQKEPFPVILFICQTKHLLISSKRMTKRLLEENHCDTLHIRFAAKDDIQTYGITAGIWEEIIVN